MKDKKKYIITSICLVLCAIIYTVLIKNVDVAAIGPDGSVVGFSRMNYAVFDAIGVNFLWYDVTKYLGIIPFGFAAFYGLIGLKQLISTKSLAKVDKKLFVLAGFYVLFVAVYVFFEKVIINYRPTLIDGDLEASYPSSHTMLAICLCGSSMMILKYYMPNEKMRKYANIFTCVLMLAIVIGRIASGVHWASDILGGIIISCAMLSLLYVGLLWADEKDNVQNKEKSKAQE